MAQINPRKYENWVKDRKSMKFVDAINLNVKLPYSQSLKGKGGLINNKCMEMNKYKSSKSKPMEAQGCEFNFLMGGGRK